MSNSNNNITKDKKKAQDMFKEKHSHDHNSVHRGHTLTNGDCLFSALYRALEKQGLLSNLKDCLKEADIFFNLNITNETVFIKNLRNIIADKADDALEEMFDIFRGWHVSKSNNNKATLHSVLHDPHGLDSSQIKLINKFILTDAPDFTEFKENYKDLIRKTGQYSTDIEFNLLSVIFDICDIRIVTHNELKKHLPYDPRTIHLFNSGNLGGGAHYEYFIFKNQAGGKKRRITMRGKRRRLSL